MADRDVTWESAVEILGEPQGVLIAASVVLCRHSCFGKGLVVYLVVMLRGPAGR